jgi:hypothetical protein
MSHMSSSRSASSSAAGGAGKKGGKKVGRGALRANEKNSECCEDYIARLSSHGSIETMEDDLLFLGRITKNVGCGNVQVLLHTGETATLPIRASVRFKGKMANKSDRANCMLADDVIVVDGGFAAGKLSGHRVQQVRKLFKSYHYTVPKGFFCLPGETAEEEENDGGGFEWDYDGTGAEEDTATGGGAGGEDYNIDDI